MITPQDFVKWLDIYLNGIDSKTLNQEQTVLVKKILSQVFTKVTPNYLDTTDYNFKDIMIGKQENPEWDSTPRTC